MSKAKEEMNSCENCYYYVYYGFCSLFQIDVEPKKINNCDEIILDGGSK